MSGFDDGSNTWPGTADNQVGKTYGPRFTGGSQGVEKTEGRLNEATFSVTAFTADQPFTFPLPQFYRVFSIDLVVEEAFAASSNVAVTIAGGTALTTPLAVSTKGITTPALTGLTNLTGTDTADTFELLLVPNANAIASATGKAKIVVSYARV